MGWIGIRVGVGKVVEGGGAGGGAAEDHGGDHTGKVFAFAAAFGDREVGGCGGCVVIGNGRRERVRWGGDVIGGCIGVVGGEGCGGRRKRRWRKYGEVVVGGGDCGGGGRVHWSRKRGGGSTVESGTS